MSRRGKLEPGQAQKAGRSSLDKKVAAKFTGAAGEASFPFDLDKMHVDEAHLHAFLQRLSSV